MTTVGLITIVGLLITFFHVRADRVGTCVQKAWWALFLVFCAVTASYNLGLDRAAHFWWYAIPATAAVFTTFFLFRGEVSRALAAFCAIFVINAAGNYFQWDSYQLLTVDLLDVLVWIQIVLLWRLSVEHPDEILSRPLGTNNNNVFRVIHGRTAGEPRNGAQI